MGRQLSLMVCAVQFLTRLPTPSLNGFQPDWIVRSMRYAPLVGVLVGALSATALLLADQIWSGLLPALIALTVGVLVTGAFHEDGLADTLDGLGGASTAERRLAIMKDSRIGVYGLLGLLLTFGMKAAALGSLPVWKAAVALIAAHAGGRGAAVVAMRLLPYVGDQGQAKLRAEGRPRLGELSLALLIALAPAVALPLEVGVAGWLLGGGFAAMVAATAHRLIGGRTGDVLGAVEQMFELGLLLGVAAVLGAS